MSLIGVKIRQKFWLTLISISVTTVILAIAGLSHCYVTLQQNTQIKQWDEMKSAVATIGSQLNRYTRTKDGSRFETILRLTHIWEAMAAKVIAGPTLKESTAASIAVTREILNDKTPEERRLALIDALGFEGRGLFYMYDAEYKGLIEAQRHTSLLILVISAGLLVMIVLLLTLLQRHVFMPLDRAYLEIVENHTIQADVLPIR